DHPLLDALSVELHAADVNELANHPWVQDVSLDAPVSPSAVPSPAKSGVATTSSATLRETLGLPRIATSTTVTGSAGVGVAIIDSGIAPGRDLTARIPGLRHLTPAAPPLAPHHASPPATHPPAPLPRPPPPPPLPPH